MLRILAAAVIFHVLLLIINIIFRAIKCLLLAFQLHVHRIRIFRLLVKLAWFVAKRYILVYFTCLFAVVIAFCYQTLSRLGDYWRHVLRIVHCTLRSSILTSLLIKAWYFCFWASYSSEWCILLGLYLFDDAKYHVSGALIVNKSFYYVFVLNLDIDSLIQHIL